MFKRDAEDHYLGSLVVMNPWTKTLGGSMVGRLKRDYLTTFVGRMDEDSRATTVARNPYDDLSRN